MQKLEKYFNLSFPILITGSTGTGKSSLAKNLFDQSNIFKKTFVEVNLASIKEELIESELFGHKKGAFTGAIENKKGFFEISDEGTLFIDEIGELSLSSQKKLLQILESKTFYAVGSLEKQQFKGRLIFATNRNLEEMVKIGEFREDLFFRINAFQINLKNLSEEKSQLKKIILNELQTIDEAKAISQTALNALENYSWPGNYRELKNALNYAVHFCESSEIQLDDLPDKVIQKNQFKITHEILKDSFEEAVQDFEARFLREQLVKNQWKINQTSKKIGLNKVTFISKIKKYQLIKNHTALPELVKSIA